DPDLISPSRTLQGTFVFPLGLRFQRSVILWQHIIRSPLHPPLLRLLSNVRYNHCRLPSTVHLRLRRKELVLWSIIAGLLRLHPDPSDQFPRNERFYRLLMCFYITSGFPDRPLLWRRQPGLLYRSVGFSFQATLDL